MTDLAQHLTRLDAAGLIRLFTDSPDLEYLFRHALVQDAAYASLLKSDRRRLHAKVGAVLESLDPERGVDLAGLLGHHFHLAGDDAKARLYFEQAADHALAVYSNAEAEAHYSAALALTTDASARAGLLYRLGRARELQGRLALAREAWRESLDHYRATGDLDAAARVYGSLAGAIYRAGDPPGALRVCDEGWVVVGTQPDSLGRYALYNTTARLHHFNGRTQDAQHWAMQGLALAERLGNIEATVQALITVGTCAADTSAETIQAFERAIALATSAGSPTLEPLLGLAHQNLGITLWEQGNFQSAQYHFAEGLLLDRRHGHMVPALHSAGSVCVIEMLLGNFAAVRQHLAALLAQARTLGEVYMARTTVPAAEALFWRLLGQLAAARASLQALVDRAWAENNVQFIIVDSHILVEVLLEQEAYAEAEAVIEAVLPLCDRGIILGRVWPRGRLVAVAAARGNFALARRWLAEARELAGPQPHLIDAESLALAAAALAAAAQDWEAALSAYTEAAAVQTAMGKRWYYAQTRRAAAAAHRARGLPADAATARALLREAHMIFTELDVPYYMALVEGELAQF